MGDLVSIRDDLDIPNTLRRIADQLEQGEFGEIQDATLIMIPHIFHMGDVCDQRAASNAVYNMNFGIHRLMQAGDEAGEQD